MLSTNLQPPHLNVQNQNMFHLPSKYWFLVWYVNVKVFPPVFFYTTSVQDLHQAYVQGLWQGGNLAEGIWDDTYGPLDA